MDRQMISALAHAHHPLASPLHDPSVARLLDRALDGGGDRMLDLGCGEGQWLLRALDGRPGLRAEGVDIDTGALTRAREGAERLGVQDRLTLHEVPAAEFSAPRPFDVVLCVGATHAYGGLLPTLAAAREHLAPGGRLLVGEGFWERSPGPEVLEVFGDGYDDLPTTVERVMAEGWTPVYAHTSTAGEWDDYEWSWTGSLAQWALDHPGHPDAAQALAVADRHRAEWLRGYRGVFGFVTLVLCRTEW